LATIKKTVAIKEKITAEHSPAKELKTKAAKKVKVEPAKKVDLVAKKVVAKKAVVKKTPAKKNTNAKSEQLTIFFKLKFNTQQGQNLFIFGDHHLLGNGILENAVPMQYFNEEFWFATVEFPYNNQSSETVTYNYVLKNADGSTIIDWGADKFFSISKDQSDELLVIDTWNHAGYIENTFYADAFQQVLLKNNFTEVKSKTPKSYTHTFKVKSPLLTKGQTVFIIGSGKELNNWSTENPITLSRNIDQNFYTVSIDLTKADFPLSYKYGVYDIETQKLVSIENGNNRILYDAIAKKKKTIVNDGYAYLPNNTWKGAGVAIPVFSLRSEKSFGIGEFTDIKLLVDWAATVGLKMVQILPINDTTATHSYKDSYPYAAISAFALHPVYLNINQIAGEKHNKQLKKLEAERLKLNELADVDYDAVIKLKTHFIKEVYKDEGVNVLQSKEFQLFFDQNKEWLTAYSVFCYLRDEYGVVDFNKWPAYKNYNAKDIEELASTNSAAYKDIALHYFIQFHLHVQLKEAADYAQTKGVILKGDIAIGVYRYGADTWQNPTLFNLNFQAGAPPDDFAVKGQNWGFPTYNWQKMQEDGFTWWKQRFAQMSHYFDAFRIDHILGFFRIWSIPIDAIEGIMGHFVPAIPVHVSEFNQKSIWFNYERFTSPYITEDVLWSVFGYDNELVKSLFLEKTNETSYQIKPAFATQKLVEAHFAALETDDQHIKIKSGLFNLLSNIILFDANGDGQNFHFRFGMENTTSFKNLDYNTQLQLKELYVNYFFRRQDDFWKEEGLKKLPALKRVTNMIVCGEDLGLVPACVPDVMKDLGLLSLEIQRMPKDDSREFFHPNDAPYLSVVTPSTHDMSTIRGWWEEDKEQIQRFYNNELGQWGIAPFYCEAWINKTIVLQYLYSPAMWSVFQLQDLLGVNEQIRRVSPLDEQINVPANPNHYWRYRMHITLEELKNSAVFNNELSEYITLSGR
jgi:4-alpha-glucanotransferase